MNDIKSLFKILITISLFVSILPQNVYAYLDPGTGSYILQMTIAVFVGTVVTIKIYWRKIKTFLSHHFSERSKEKDNE